LPLFALSGKIEIAINHPPTGRAQKHVYVPPLPAAGARASKRRERIHKLQMLTQLVDPAQRLLNPKRLLRDDLDPDVAVDPPHQPRYGLRAHEYPSLQPAGFTPRP
jgi:hypothetical protein